MGFCKNFYFFPILLLILFFSIAVAQDSLPFFDNFDDGDCGDWMVYDIAPYADGPSNWVVIAGVLTQTSNIYTTEDEYSVYTGTRIITGDTSWSDYSFSVELKSTDDDGVGLLFRYRNEGDYYRYIRVEDEGNGGPFRRIERCSDSVFTILAQDIEPISYPPNYYCVTVWVSGESIKVFEEGVSVLTACDTTYSSGMIGFMCYANNGSFFDNVAVVPGLVIDSIATQIRAGPYVQNPEENAITIMWETTAETDGKLYWGESLIYTDSIDATYGKMHEVRIEGLSPQTRYYYAVGVEDTIISGEEYYFDTKPHPTTPYRMAIWGDNRTDYISHEHVVDAIIEECPLVAVNVGDVVTSGTVYEQWVNEYFWPARNLLKNTASYISIGNHEVDADWFDYYVCQPNNEHWFSVRYGPAYLIFIDTNRLYFPLSTQYNWIYDELSSTEAQEAPWLFVFHHHPPYSEGWDSPGYDGEQDIRDYLVPLYEYYDVDICFAGHTHDYERGEKDGVAYVISGGGGAALDTWQQDWSYIFVYQSLYQYIILDIDTSYVIFRCYDWDGCLVDSTLFGIYLGSEETPTDKPLDVTIFGSAPNPFNDIVRIDYYTSNLEDIEITIHDITGKRIAKIAEGSVAPGNHSVWWDTRETKRRSTVPSGVYIVNLVCRTKTVEHKIILAK
ncbi:hypothetical protein DRQ33_08270 [bacterium]|nr:MAG: hypothetical protein DRQ33_08270 [bacterium]